MNKAKSKTLQKPLDLTPYPPLSMAEKILVCFCAGMALLFTLWLVAIHLGVTRG